MNPYVLSLLICVHMKSFLLIFISPPDWAVYSIVDSFCDDCVGQQCSSRYTLHKQEEIEDELFYPPACFRRWILWVGIENLALHNWTSWSKLPKIANHLNKFPQIWRWGCSTCWWILYGDLQSHGKRATWRAKSLNSCNAWPPMHRHTFWWRSQSIATMPSRIPWISPTAVSIETIGYKCILNVFPKRPFINIFLSPVGFVIE